MSRFFLPVIVTISCINSTARAQPLLVNTPETPGPFVYRAGFYRGAPHYNRGFSVSNGSVTVFATAAPPYWAFGRNAGNPYEPFEPYGGTPAGVWRPRTEP